MQAVIISCDEFKPACKSIIDEGLALEGEKRATPGEEAKGRVKAAMDALCKGPVEVGDKKFKLTKRQTVVCLRILKGESTETIKSDLHVTRQAISGLRGAIRQKVCAVLCIPITQEQNIQTRLSRKKF